MEIAHIGFFAEKVYWRVVCNVESYFKLIKNIYSLGKIFLKSKWFIVVLLSLILPVCAGGFDETRLFEIMQKVLAHGDRGENTKATVVLGENIDNLAREMIRSHPSWLLLSPNVKK